MTIVGSTVRRLFRGVAKVAECPSFWAYGHNFTRWQAFNKPYGLWNKAGRLSWQAVMDGTPVKAYECDSDDHAAFVEYISNEPALAGTFPDCLLRVGRIVVVEWSEGKPIHKGPQSPISSDRIVRLAQLQARLHSFVPPSSSGTEMLYIEYLRRRFSRFRGLIQTLNFESKIGEALTTMPLGEARLSHPDLVPNNVLEAAHGRLQVIDNELLGANTYFLFDLFNTHRSLVRKGPSVVEAYVRAYMSAGADLRGVIRDGAFYNALWHLRSVGSAMQLGRYAEAVAMADAYVAGNRHPLLAFVGDQLGVTE